MAIQLVDRNGLLSTASQELAKRRLLFALSRFEPRIQRTVVTFEDINGPRGGPDKACRVVVTLRAADNVVFMEQDAQLETCISRAAERTGRAVARAIERARRFGPSTQAMN